MESFRQLMDICYSTKLYPGWIKYQYRRFFKDQQLSDAFVWCRNKADFFSLLFYWSNSDWVYKPALDEYGYILIGQ